MYTDIGTIQQRGLKDVIFLNRQNFRAILGS